MTESKQEFRRDQAAALQFQNCVVPHFLGPWIPDLIGYAGLQKGDRVLDVACGTGAVTRAIAEKIGSSGSVAGLDMSPEMVAVAKQVTGSPVPAIEWHIGDAASLPFADSSFDVVLCQQGLQFFTDRPGAVREFRRVLSPSGKMAVAVWSKLENNLYFQAVIKTATRYLGEEVGRQFHTSFSLAEPAELRTLLLGAGFKSVEVKSLARTMTLPPLEEFLPRHLASTSLASIFASIDSETQAGIFAGVARELRIEDTARESAFSFEVNLGRAE